MELLAGCGSSLIRRVGEHPWTNLITLDFNADHNPDVVWDLEKLPYPFPDNQFEEVHVYDVLEHLGQQGDWKSFFDQMAEFWRITKPEGMLFGIVPWWNSLWAWGDPSHKRIINAGTLAFLNQDSYTEQVGETSISDFRFYYKADWKPIQMFRSGNSFVFILKAHK